MNKCCAFFRQSFLSLLLLLSIEPASAQMTYFNTEPAFKKPAVQIGFKYAYIAPLNNFGMEFSRSPQYELYCQLRNQDGNGRLSGRIGIYYTSPAPRMDSIPAYLIYESNGTTLYPGYVSYQKFYMSGIFIEYAYRIVRYKGFALDAGLGLTIGKYRMEYDEGYTGMLTQKGIIEETTAGLRMHLALAYQINRYFEIYGEAMNSQITQTDWSTKFPNNTYGLGVNFTFNPRSKNEY